MSSSSHSPLSPQQSNLNSPSVTIILTIILLVFFFIGFFSIYFCRCFMDNMLNSWHLRRTPSGNIINGGAPANEGLDPSLILLFPSFIYSSVKDFRWEKNIGLECAICIAEFEDDDSLRLLTVCSHVFHQECIDLWLKSHKTCPVCRSDLNLPRETLEKAQILDHYNVNDMENTRLDLINNDSNRKIEPLFEHTICIDVKDGDDDEKCQRENGEGTTTGDHDRDGDHTKVESKNLERIERFSRSHSTGHSIAMTREDEDRYTLRLLEHVKFKIKNAHNTTESCITFGEFSSGDLNCV